MERVEVTTVVYADQERVFEFLLDFPGYARYSEYLTRVDQRGDGGVGTRYDLQFAWWKLTYAARSAVVDVEPPDRIDWKVTKDIDATGHWYATPVDPPEGEDAATEVRFLVEYDPDSARVGNVDLPRFVSVSWVVEKAKPKIRTEAERIVERVVADLEGRHREVELAVDTG